MFHMPGLICPISHALPFPGYTLTGHQIAAHLQDLTGYPVRLKRMNWLPLHLAKPVWPMARCLLEMRYLWNTPHSLDGTRFNALLPGFTHTPVTTALASALPQDTLRPMLSSQNARSTQTIL